MDGYAFSTSALGAGLAELTSSGYVVREICLKLRFLPPPVAIRN